MNLGFRIGWRGGVPWIHTALSTLRPATSPCLSSIRLDFSCSHYFDPAIETLIGNMGNDLRLIADEVSRIEREFEGAVNLTVLRDPKFELVLDTLNVRFRSLASMGSGSHVDFLHSSLADPSTPRSIRLDLAQ